MLLAISMGGYAQADCTKKASECLADEAKALTTEGKYGEAAQKYLASYEADPITETYQLYAAALTKDGQFIVARAAWEQTSKLVEADLTKARSASPQDPNEIRELEQLAETVKGALAQMLVKTVRVKLRCGSSESASRTCPVSVARANGAEVASWGEGFVVLAGGDSVVLRFDDGKSETLRINLVQPGPGREPVLVDVVEHGTTKTGTTGTEDREPSNPSNSSGGGMSLAHRISLGAAGLALVSLGVSGWAALDARSLRDKAKENNGCNADLTACTNMDSFNTAKDAHSRGNLATGFLIGGVALAGAATALWFLGQSSSEAPTSWRATPAIAPSHVGFAFEGRF